MIRINKYKDTHNSESLTQCSICGNSVAIGELFCEKCGMRIHSHQCRKSISKANLRSRYIFYLERDYENAKDAIYYGNRTIYDKLYWYGDWGCGLSRRYFGAVHHQERERAAPPPGLCRGVSPSAGGSRH